MTAARHRRRRLSPLAPLAPLPPRLPDRRPAPGATPPAHLTSLHHGRPSASVALALAAGAMWSWGAGAGCAGGLDDTPGSIAQAVGEPQGDFPSPEERLGILAINRARSDPSTWKGPKSVIFPAVAPIAWDYDLSRASRFHAINMKSAGSTLMHSSPCALKADVGTSGCDGDTACACKTPVPGKCAKCAAVPAVNDCGTDTFARIGYFSGNATGEVAAAGYADTWDTVDGWTTEPDGADGHRRNLLDVGIRSNVMGFGRTVANTCRFSSFDVSDSGLDRALKMPLVPSASPRPAAPPAGTVRFYATWADAGRGAPASLTIVVDGKCSAMTRELGDAALNSTWIADVPLAAGCHAWWVLGQSAAGQRVTYPTVGAVNTSVGGGACVGGYQKAAPAADCEVVPATLDLAPSARRDLAQPSPGGGDDLAGQIPDGAAAPVGAPCSAAADCRSRVCAIVNDTSGFCTDHCDPSGGGTPCPAGFVCGTIDESPFCVQAPPGNAGGCSVAPVGGAAGGPHVVLLMLALAWLGRRRSRLRGLWWSARAAPGTPVGTARAYDARPLPR